MIGLFVIIELGITSIRLGAVLPSEDFVTAGQCGSETDNRRPDDRGIARAESGHGDPSSEHIRRRLGRGRNRLGVRSLGEGRRDERIGAGRVRLGWAKQRQMGSDRCEGGRGHADYASELIGGLERRTRRSVIEPCCAIVREHPALRSGDGGGAGPFADRVCETTRSRDRCR